MRWTTGSGHEVRLTRLEQSLTYRGLMEGLPTDRMNQRKLDGLMQKHPRAHLIAPRRTPIEGEEDYPFGVPERLPRVCCVARLQGRGITHIVAYASGLTLIWFQDDWARPVAPEVVAAIEALNWAAVAEEWER